jgi:hypothetical protein
MVPRGIRVGDVTSHQFLPRAQQIHVALELARDRVQHVANPFGTSLAIFNPLKMNHLAQFVAAEFCRTAVSCRPFVLSITPTNRIHSYSYQLLSGIYK